MTVTPKRTPPTFPKTPTFSPGVEMVEAAPNTFLVWTVSGGQKRAEQVVGCGVCAVEGVGEVWRIERFPSPRINGVKK